MNRHDGTSLPTEAPTEDLVPRTMRAGAHAALLCDPQIQLGVVDGEIKAKTVQSELPDIDDIA